jgi:quinol-cytochrome oxidoreductase complex cytochrome b subunit
MRLARLPFISIYQNHLINYPTPLNLNYAWGFGSLAGFYLVIQLVTGLILACHYTPHEALAFNSVEHIMRNVNGGWLFRYMHANGASMFFIIVYLHIARGLFYSSYMHPRGLVWSSGVIIFLLMMAAAFTGYVLPWGQMSFWGCTVICNLFTAIPYVGETIVQWLWGGPVVNNATLKRFFVFHFLLPFVISGFVLIHLALLHNVGSGNPLGIDTGIPFVTFYPYFFIKDLFMVLLSLIPYSILVFFWSNYLGHPDNYIPADPMKTPAHIVPEWYFLPFYAMLRSIPHKLGGVICMLASIVILFFASFFNLSNVRSSYFKPLSHIAFWLFIANFFFLGWIGQMPVREPYITCGQIGTVFYFAYFIILLPLLGLIEDYLLKRYIFAKNLSS